MSMSRVTTIECSDDEFAIIDGNCIVFCRAGNQRDRDLIVQILARDLQRDDLSDEAPCTVMGYCQVHKTGHPHTATGREYLE
jgi:hypothetical protein